MSSMEDIVADTDIYRKKLGDRFTDNFICSICGKPFEPRLTREESLELMDVETYWQHELHICSDKCGYILAIVE